MKINTRTQLLPGTLFLGALCLSSCIVVVDRNGSDRKASAVTAAQDVPPEPVEDLPEPEPEPGPPIEPKAAPSEQASRAALEAALGWIAANQTAEGSWLESSGGDKPERVSVGVTALCTLALLSHDAHRPAAERGLAWLAAQQNDEGRVGPMLSHDFLYGHGIATFALSQALGAEDAAVDRGVVQAAVDFIHRARNPYAAWRYDVPPVGDNDTSVTGWMLAALVSARDAGLMVDEAAFEGGMAWIDEATDPATGRVGYDSVGSLSSRTPANEWYPRENGEAMTAIGLLSRAEIAGSDVNRSLLASHARLLKRSLPEWDTDGFGCDMYYWYHGTRAMRALGGDDWQVWRAALLDATVGNQGKDGSWDPVGPWGYVGGRPYATALCALAVGECLGD